MTYKEEQRLREEQRQAHEHQRKTQEEEARRRGQHDESVKREANYGRPYSYNG